MKTARINVSRWAANIAETHGDMKTCAVQVMDSNLSTVVRVSNPAGDVVAEYDTGLDTQQPQPAAHKLANALAGELAKLGIDAQETPA